MLDLGARRVLERLQPLLGQLALVLAVRCLRVLDRDALEVHARRRRRRRGAGVRRRRGLGRLGGRRSLSTVIVAASARGEQRPAAGSESRGLSLA